MYRFTTVWAVSAVFGLQRTAASSATVGPFAGLAERGDVVAVAPGLGKIFVVGGKGVAGLVGADDEDRVISGRPVRGSAPLYVE